MPRVEAPGGRHKSEATDAVTACAGGCWNCDPERGERVLDRVVGLLGVVGAAVAVRGAVGAGAGGIGRLPALMAGT